MENNTDLKHEMQRDLATLQQNISEHSHFDTAEWRQTLLRRTRQLYRRNLVAVAGIVVLVTVVILMTLNGSWPWWVGVPAALYFGVMVVDNLIATRGMARPDVESEEGLRALRETLKRSTTPTSGWRKAFYMVGGLTVGTLVLLQMVPGERWMYVLIIPVSGIAGYIVSKRVSKRYKKLGDDVADAESPGQ